MTDRTRLPDDDPVPGDAREARLREALDALPRSLPPTGDDPWPAIRARIEAGRVLSLDGVPEAASRVPPLRPPRLWPALVGSGAMAAAGALFLLWRAPQRVPGAGTGELPGTVAVVAPSTAGASALPVARSLPPALAEAMADYDAAARDLEAAIARDRASLSPATQAVLDRSLAAIDSALAEAAAALARDPRSPELGRFLDRVQRQRLDFLRQAVALARS